MGDSSPITRSIPGDDVDSFGSPSTNSINEYTVGKNSVQAVTLTKKCLELNDSEDDLNDESVNLVVLDEVTNNQYSEILFMHFVISYSDEGEKRFTEGFSLVAVMPKWGEMRLADGFLPAATIESSHQVYASLHHSLCVLRSL